MLNLLLLVILYHFICWL